MDETRDANGTTLADGDTVTPIEDLKVKGTSTTWSAAPRSRTSA